MKKFKYIKKDGTEEIINTRQTRKIITNMKLNEKIELIKVKEE